MNNNRQLSFVAFSEITLVIAFIFLLVSTSHYPNTVFGAKYCISGQNKQVISKQCSQGSFDMDHVCQKFTCVGGKSPFTLRTCATKKLQCSAGPVICKFSGGSGQCERCETDNCNQ